MDGKSIAAGFVLGLVVSTGVYFLVTGGDGRETPSKNDDHVTAESCEEKTMRIKLASIFVDDQDKALEFYTGILGFVVKDDIPLGEFRWLSVVSAEAPEGMELVLEPNAHDAARAFQKAIHADGIPATSFFVDDIRTEYERLKELGVAFTMEPTEAGPVTIAIFDDTCGNLIQITEQ